MPPLHDILILIVAGFVTGMINVTATGGALVLFLVLNTLLGNPMMANATNLMVTPFSYARGFLRLRDHPEYSSLLLFAGTGCAVGVALLATYGNACFAVVAPWLVLAAAGLMAVEPLLKRWHGTAASPRLPTLIGLFLVSIYAGLFGASFGTLVLTVLTFTTAWMFDQAARVKNLVCLATSLVGLVVIPLLHLPVNWGVFVVLVGPMLLGGLLGERLLTWLPRTVLRGITIAVSLAGGLILLLT